MPKLVLFDDETAVELPLADEAPAFKANHHTFVSHLFLGLLMVQYILMFFAIPFSEVDNRPVASVLLCLLGYLLFLLCALMIPASLVNKPSLLTLKCALATVALKTFEVASNIYSVVLCFQVSKPMFEYNYDLNHMLLSPSDITVYVRTVAILLLALSTTSLFLAGCVFVFTYSHLIRSK